MKFELKSYNRNASNEDILEDIKSVANQLSKRTLTESEYKKHGRYSYSTATKRFGSWVKVMILAGLEVSNYHKIEDTELLEDLKKVAEMHKKKSLTESEYKAHGKYSADPFARFGSWNLALKKAGLEKSKNIYITTDELFENLEEIWTKLGRQPNYGEVTKPFSKYSKDTYFRRFGSWQKALEAFVKYINENKDNLSQEIKSEHTAERIEEPFSGSLHKTTRNINWRLRFIVMKRDNFKCKNCGRSPATDPTIILHVDHIKAWANGGETVLDNLQTLCSICNIGKSDLE